MAKNPYTPGGQFRYSKPRGARAASFTESTALVPRGAAILRTNLTQDLTTGATMKTIFFLYRGQKRSVNVPVNPFAYKGTNHTKGYVVPLQRVSNAPIVSQSPANLKDKTALQVNSSQAEVK